MTVARVFVTISAILTGQAALATTYGAIAYSASTGSHGYSYDYPTRADAEYRAMQECNAYGPGCQVATWFQGQCGALATGQTGGWGGSYGATQYQAEQKALQICRQHDRNCQIVRWVCTSR